DPERDHALERGVDRDRLHDVGDDQDLEPEQDRPAHALPDALVRLLEWATEQLDREAPEREDRADDEHPDPRDLETADDVLHHVLEARRADHASHTPPNARRPPGPGR